MSGAAGSCSADTGEIWISMSLKGLAVRGPAGLNLHSRKDFYGLVCTAGGAGMP